MDKPLDDFRASTARPTPKDFFMWAGAIVSLWGGVIAFLALVFDYINYAFPDTLSSYYYSDPYSSISYEMASLIVLAPVFLILMRFIRRDIARDPSRNDVWVRRWGLFLTLFVAATVIVVDLIVLLTTFLSGEELSARFLLKVVVVLLVASAGFMHFVADLRGFWAQFPSRAGWVNWATALLIVLVVVSGFFIVGSPQTARQYRMDERRVQDLQSIQSQVINYYQQKEKLPTNLAELNDPLSYFTLPKDPATGGDYAYRTTGAPGANPSFEVCATFSLQSRGIDASYAEPIGRHVGMDEKWLHGAGQTCFERVIDPDLYPPYNPKPLR